MDDQSALSAAISQASWDLARQREDALREAAREYLPSPLRWAVEHPRILRALYRLRRSWAPRVVYGFDQDSGVAVTQRKDGTVVVSDSFRVERDR